MAQKITVADLKKMDREMLPPAIVGRVLGVTPGWVSYAAKERPEWLPVPALVVKSRVKIPRLALIRWLEGSPPDPDGEWQQEEEE